MPATVDVTRMLGMAKRPTHRRAQDFKPGVITGWPKDADRQVAETARYIADGKHKDYPAPNGEWVLVRNSEGTKCPVLAPERWADLTKALQEALLRGVVGGGMRGAFPARAWVFLDERLCEARLSNEVLGEYHGFPLDYEEHSPSDPEGHLGLAPRIESAS